MHGVLFLPDEMDKVNFEIISERLYYKHTSHKSIRQDNFNSYFPKQAETLNFRHRLSRFIAFSHKRPFLNELLRNILVGSLEVRVKQEALPQFHIKDGKILRKYRCINMYLQTRNTVITDVRVRMIDRWLRGNELPLSPMNLIFRTMGSIPFFECWGISPII